MLVIPPAPPYPGNMGQEVVHPTRERILRTAADLMWQHGFGKTSPGLVMKTCGVGQGSFYYHFPDKKSLGLAVIDDIVGRTIASLDGVFGTSQPPLDQVRSWLHAGRSRYRPPCDRGCPLGRLAIEMANENGEFRESLSRGFRAILSRLTLALEDASAAGQLDPAMHPRSLAELLLSGMEGAILVSQCVNEPGPMDRSIRLLEELLDRFERPGPRCAGRNGDP